MDRSELGEASADWPVVKATRDIRVLLIERDHEAGLSIAGFLEPAAEHSPGLAVRHRFLVIAKPTLDDVLQDGALPTPELILADLNSIEGTLGVERLKQKYPQAKLITLSGQGSLTLAIESMHAGAWDFLTKPIQKQSLLTRLAEITRTLPAQEQAMPTKTHQSAAPRAKSALAFEGFCGTSDAMVEFYRQIQRIAPSQAPVFIHGASGSGKDLCAQALHKRSKRAEKPFLALNCRSIPHYLLENELFGRSNATLSDNADEDRVKAKDQIGLAELADGGTLFLDEITELDLATQAKLLSFLQTGTIRRAGDIMARAIDVRIICATSHNIRHAISQGRFREDLFYRLHVLPVNVPSLRDRLEDVKSLANYFLDQFSREESRQFTRLSDTAYECLQSYSWPGNVRELQNAIRHAVVMNEGMVVEHTMLPSEIATLVSPVDPIWLINRANEGHLSSTTHSRDEGFTTCLPFWKQEQAIIETALLRHDGNISRAAAALEISPSTIYRKRQSWMGRMGGDLAAE
ncbi:MAG: sigma-54-dependent Fis family transcriptional regulator [Hyphomicrobiales bacterium]|nr:MAG: sigma-54-dependent Fis family transcriptional regulator [Hyphomicrobiales bacterium]